MEKHPKKILEQMATDLKLDIDSREFADKMDELDSLKGLRDMFFYPKMGGLPQIDLSRVDADEDSIYFCGHSLGLMPKGVQPIMNRELEKWATKGVFGHFVDEIPWAKCDLFALEGNARLVGAKKDEIAVMNGLTVNIHLMMIPFYRPTPTRNKILLESKAFPSDHYAIQSQIQFHGYDPSECMICMEPRPGEGCLRTEDILETIERHGDSIALVFFPGVQYYTGQLFEIERITKAGKEKGCVVGWDLAHAVGNVPLHLHDWNVDFAVWCSYKYMNSSCGGLSGMFLHEDHFDDQHLPRFTGWWSHREQTRMDMTNEMELSPGASGFRISNPPILLICPMLASLEVFEKTTPEELRRKSLLLTGYLEYLILSHFGQRNSTNNDVTCEILTPSDPNQRGCQLSLLFSTDIHRIYEELKQLGVVCDKRLPRVLRVAPIPLYNRFSDVYRFVFALRTAIQRAAN